jgi:pimeloyl-ACP methyl ester carboxylesterase
VNVDLGDITVHVDEWGSGAPLVLLHGYMGSGRDFLGVAPQLAEDRRVIAVSHRGHGESSNTGESTYSFAQLGTDLARTIDALGLDTFDLLGHSMGGILSMAYVLARPARVRSLILMDTAAAPATTEQPEIMVALATMACEQGMAALWDQVGDVWSAAVTDEDIKAHMRTAVLALDPFALRELGAELFDYPSMLHDLAGVTSPTTVLVGENDIGLRAGADDLARTIPAAVLTVIPDAAHSPQVEQPEAWLAAVRAHLARVEA